MIFPLNCTLEIFLETSLKSSIRLKLKWDWDKKLEHRDNVNVGIKKFIVEFLSYVKLI